MSHNITVEGGTSVRLKTAGKYCDRDIVVKSTGGGGEAIEPVIDSLTITENGTYTAPDGVDGYSPVTVNVPIPDGYIQPSGTKTITENGSYDVAEKASVLVDVPERLPILQEKTVTENGEVTPDAGYDGLSKVTVNVESSGGGGDLPAGWWRCDYIHFTEEQIVDTGVICNQNTKLRVLFTREKSSQHYLYGIASSDNTASVTAYLGGSWRFGNKSSTKNPTTTADMIYSGVVDSSKITITGSAATISGVNEFETVGSLLLGSCRDAAGSIGSAQFKGKIFLFAMWEGTKQVLKLVPVTDGTVYRFYDTVSKTFFDSITDTLLDGGNF